MLGSLWRDRPAVVVWLRHFGCLFCKEQASELRKVTAEIRDAGARLAFVGHGDVAFAQAFHDHYVPHCAVYTDPSAYTYRTLGARESALGTIAGVGIHGLRAMARGHFQTRILGRAFQNGGVLIALPGDIAAYTYISRVAGDHPHNDVIVAGLQRAVTGEPTPAVYEALHPELAGVLREEERHPVASWTRPSHSATVWSGGAWPEAASDGSARGGALAPTTAATHGPGSGGIPRVPPEVPGASAIPAGVSAWSTLTPPPAPRFAWQRPAAVDPLWRQDVGGDAGAA